MCVRVGVIFFERNSTMTKLRGAYNQVQICAYDKTFCNLHVFSSPGIVQQRRHRQACAQHRMNTKARGS